MGARRLSIQARARALVLVSLTCAPALLFGCRSSGLPDDRGPPLVDDEPELSPPALAPHGAVRYSGTSHLRAADGRAQRVEVPGRLESLVLTFKDAGGRVRLKLIGTVHLATPACFAALRSELEGAAAVLYESLSGVHDEHPEARAAGRRRASHTSRAGAAGELVDQSQGLPPGPRWRVADLTWDDVQQRLDRLAEVPGAETSAIRPDALEERRTLASPGARRRDLHELALSLVGYRGFGDRPELWPADLGDRPRERLLAEPPEGERPADFEPADIVLLLARNDVVLAALERELAKAPEGFVAVVYGAAHIRDIAHRSARRFGLSAGGETWHTVYNLRRDETR